MQHLINASKVWLLCIVHTNLSINGDFVLYTPIHQLTEKKKMFPCTKLSMRNGMCEHNRLLCARAPRARQDSCRIW